MAMVVNAGYGGLDAFEEEIILGGNIDESLVLPRYLHCNFAVMESTHLYVLS